MRQSQPRPATRNNTSFLSSHTLRRSNGFLWAVGVLFCLTAGSPTAMAQDASTIVYVDALWQRVHLADSPHLILKDQKQTMTLGEADQLGYRLGEYGQSGRDAWGFGSYQRQYPVAAIPDDTLGVAEVRPGDILKWHVHGCHRFTPVREDLRMTKAEALATPGSYHCEHCLERGPGIAQMTQAAWDALPSRAPWVAPIGWSPSSFPVDTYPEQVEIDILLSEALHGSIGIQERTFINPVATVDNFVIMRFFFPVHRWLELYMTYRTTGDANVLEQLRASARNYNALSQNYLSAAQYKARDPEGMAYMYTMAASARITLQLAQKYPGQVTPAEIAEAEDFLLTIMSVLQPICEDNSNLDPVMGIPQPLADDFRSRAFNRALNGIGTMGMTVAALEDLQTLNSTTAYQSTIDRYRLIIQEYIINWRNTGFYETFEGNDYFSYPYSATDNGSWNGDVKLFAADDKGHFSHSMQGCYVLYDSVPELGMDDAFMTAIANTIEFNSYTTSGSPQTPSQEAIRPYSRKPYSGTPSDRMYLLNAFNSGVIDGQNSPLTALARESTNSQFAYRLATFNALYLKERRLDQTLIHLGEESVAPPAPPTGLAGTGSNGQVDLDWDDNSESDMVSGTYSVYRSETSGSGYTEIAAGLTSSDYVDTAVVNETLYFYVVTATDSNGDSSSNSAEAFAAPFVANGTPPSAPTGLSAAATDGSVTLDWADNGEADFNSYNLYRSATSGSYGAPLAIVTSSDYLDTDVVNGTPYFYVVRAVDHSGNLSVQSAEISATPASYGPTITFGSNDDGFGGFNSSASTGTEVWSQTAGSVQYAFGLPATDEGHTASLTKSYAINRTVGSSYTMEGVVDLTAGYGDDNNRIGLLLFNATPTQTGDGGGLYLRLNADDGKDLAIKNGINGGTLVSNPTGVSNGDSWIGQTLTFTADLDFVDVAGVDKIDISFTLTDGSQNTYTASAQVDAAAYPGTYFGFATKWRQRGDGGSRDAPPVMDYQSFSVIDHTPVVNDPPVFTSNPIVEDNADEDASYESSIADNASDPDSDPLTFTKVSGPAWLTVIPNGDLIGTPTSGDVGLNSFTVSVSDSIAPPVQATLEITVNAAPVNQPPSFTSDPIVEGPADEGVAYTATIADNASDPESDPMSFSKVSGPAWLSVATNGALSGTPGAGDVGLNSFTVQVDATGGSDTASLEITVNAATPGGTAPGLYYGEVAGNINTTDPNPETYVTVDLAETENSISNNTTEIFTGQIYDADGNIAFTENIDDKTRIYIDGVEVLASDNWNDRVSTSNLNLTPGWHDLEIRISNGSGGSGPSGSPGIGFDPNGGTSWVHLEDPGDGSLLRHSTGGSNSAPVFTTDPVIEVGATEDLAYSASIADNASDADSDPLTFSKLSGPVWLNIAPNGALTGTPANSDVGLNNFSVEVDDGNGGTDTATLTITVNAAGAPSTVPLVSAASRLAYASFDTDASDGDGNLTMAAAGGATIEAGAGNFSGSVRFNGSGDEVTIGDHPNFNTGNPPYIERTVSLWFKVDAVSGRQMIFEAGGSTRGFNMYLEDDTLYVGGWDSASDGTDTGTWPGTWRSVSGVTAGQWHHVALVLDASGNPTAPVTGQFFAYLNGVEFDVGNSIGMQLWNHGDDAGIGGLNGSSKYFSGSNPANMIGSADDFAVWNRALSASEIATLAGVTLNTPPQVSFNTPSDGESVPVGTDLYVWATASDSDGSISNLKLYLDGQFVRQENMEPYEWGLASQNDTELQNMAIGSYTLSVIAEDDQGATTQADITLSVEASAPSIQTETAGNITVDRADVGFTVVDDGGQTPTVFLFHGESNGGTTPANWDNSQNLGALGVGSYAVTLTGLTEGTTYFYSVQAFNTGGVNWGSTLSFTTDVDTSPKLVRSQVSGVTETWQTFDLGQSYTSAVIIATPVLPDSSHPPVVSRIQNVSGSTFDLKVERVDGLTGGLNMDVSVIAVEEGVYTQAADGVTLEAVKMTSTVTAENNNWSSELRSYQNTYTNPVVVGQVISANDPLWSVFWCQGSSRSAAPSASTLRVGKHVGEDPVTTRADETLGYIVIESGTGTINGVAYTAGVGGDDVSGVSNVPTGFTYTLTGLSSASAAAATLAGMDGSDGGVAVLYGPTPLTSTGLTLVVDEDQLGDGERSHTKEDIGYLVFE